MTSIIWQILFWLLLAGSCGYALVRGGVHERIAALLFVGATIVSILAHSPLHVRYVTIEMSDLIVDLVVLGVLVFIALQSERFWPLWATGLQLTITMSHLMKGIQPDLMPLAYAAAQRFWSYPILIILFVGSWRSYRRRVRQAMPDPV